MKNPPFLLFLFSICAFTLGCDKCKNNCETEVSVNAVLPDNNPAGYEVLLKTSGLSQSAKVVFGTVEASSRAGGNSDEIIAKVPNGLSGNVEISVEEGDCIARHGDFIVSGKLPGDVQPSFEQIIVPVPTTFPGNDFTNAWVNAAPGSTLRIFIQGTLVNGFAQIEEPNSEEQDISPNPDSYFVGNKIKGTINNNTNTIYLEIDRSAKPGGFVEHFDGQFIQKPEFLPASIKPAILLTSRETGRQLLLYFG